jgi:hypothetical protein
VGAAAQAVLAANAIAVTAAANVVTAVVTEVVTAGMTAKERKRPGVVIRNRVSSIVVLRSENAAPRKLASFKQSSPLEDRLTTDIGREIFPN